METGDAGGARDARARVRCGGRDLWFSCARAFGVVRCRSCVRSSRRGWTRAADCL